MVKQYQDTDYEIVIHEAQLQERIALLGQQISQDFDGRGVLCIGVLENGFVFLADLVRSLTCDVRCQFVKPYVRELHDSNVATTEIFYAPEVDVLGRHVLLCEGIVSTGQTTEFLFRNIQARGAASVALCALLNRQSARRVDLDVTYSGFEVGPQWLAGFGLGSPTLNRNLPFVFATSDLHI